MEFTRENIQNLRQDYRAAKFSEDDADENPLIQFEKWFQEAVNAQLYEPNVMTLATADRFGRPSARIVLLKGFSEDGFIFYTNYESKKGQDLNENPQAALVFFWAELERQVRVEGLITKVSEAESAQYFQSRPVGSQISALASPQSRVVAIRSELERSVEELSQQYKDQHIPKPPHWGGYLVEPTHIEFWQGRSSRLHDRICYNLIDGLWTVNRLAP